MMNCSVCSKNNIESRFIKNGYPILHCKDCDHLFTDGEFNLVDFKEVQRLAASCSTGCEIANPGLLSEVPEFNGFKFRLAVNAVDSLRN